VSPVSRSSYGVTLTALNLILRHPATNRWLRGGKPAAYPFQLLHTTSSYNQTSTAQRCGFYEETTLYTASVAVIDTLSRVQSEIPR
jgi:hypothetical protein